MSKKCGQPPVFGSDEPCIQFQRIGPNRSILYLTMLTGYISETAVLSIVVQLLFGFLIGGFVDSNRVKNE